MASSSPAQTRWMMTLGKSMKSCDVGQAGNLAPVSTDDPCVHEPSGCHLGDGMDTAIAKQHVYMMVADSRSSTCSHLERICGFQQSAVAGIPQSQKFCA